MTSREVLEAAMRGEPADRVGWAPEINDTLTTRNLRKAGIDPAADPLPYATSNRLLGADCLHRKLPYRVEYDGVRFETRTEGNESVETIETPKGILSSRRRYIPETDMWFRYELHVKGPADYAVWADVVGRTRFVTDYDSVLNADRLLGDRGILSIEAPCTPYMDFVMWRMGAEEIVYQTADHERELIDLFELMHRKNLEAHRIAAGSPLGLLVRPIEDTSSMLSSPRLFRKFVLRHMREYAEIAHAGGKLFLPHMCGHLHDMLPILKDLPIDGIEAITPPPTGDCPITYARRALGKERILIGGLDATRFALSPPEEFERMVREVLEAMKGDPRFVLGHEEIHRNARPENLTAVRRLIRGG